MSTICKVGMKKDRNGRVGSTVSSDIILYRYTWVYVIAFLICYWLCWVLSAVRALLSCGEQGLLLVAVCGLLSGVASLVAERRL